MPRLLINNLELEKNVASPAPADYHHCRRPDQAVVATLITAATQAQSVTERLADHATNIAETVIFLTEGKIVRHTPEGSEVKPQL